MYVSMRQARKFYEINGMFFQTLEILRSSDCNLGDCPVDCLYADWGGCPNFSSPCDDLKM